MAALCSSTNRPRLNYPATKHTSPRPPPPPSTHQEGLVEFKGTRELPLQLMDTVQPLQEDGTALVQVLRVLPVAAAVRKLVSKLQPLRLHQHLEALDKHQSQHHKGAARNAAQSGGNAPARVPPRCGSKGPAAAWTEPQSEACGPSRRSSAPGPAGGPGPRRGQPAELPSAAGTDAAATWCSPEQRASCRHTRRRSHTHTHTSADPKRWAQNM